MTDRKETRRYKSVSMNGYQLLDVFYDDGSTETFCAADEEGNPIERDVEELVAEGLLEPEVMLEL